MVSFMFASSPPSLSPSLLLPEKKAFVPSVWSWKGKCLPIWWGWSHTAERCGAPL